MGHALDPRTVSGRYRWGIAIALAMAACGLSMLALLAFGVRA
jgi:hypothetical protein